MKVEVAVNEISSKTLYEAKNRRSIDWLKEENIPKKKSSRTPSNLKINEEYKSIEEMTFKEKTKNFLENYEDLFLMITQKSL